MRSSLLAVFALLGVFARPTYADRAGLLPEIKSKAAFILDAETGAEIFGKDADVARPIASTTKIFVAMVVRKRRIDLDGWTPITKVDAAYAKGGARTRLDVGQAFRNRDLLRAMLIASDNRAPTALGRAVGLDPDQLIAAMNRLARELRLSRTSFTDPSGLRGNTSTARELAIALRAALEDDVLAEIMSTDHIRVVSKGGDRIDYTNTNQPLLAQRYDVLGGKTGYTDAAGYCFVTAARLDDHDVVMAFLGAEGKLTRWGDFNRVASWIQARKVATPTTAKKRAKRSSDDD
jgi:D-alanyl-D-alanine endopeptidase (penicillin-binding protein 7)